MRTIDDDEFEIYDRQIRLWGVDAQKKILNASILIINFEGIAVEVAKNIVLAGAGNVTLYDEKLLKESDLSYNYFARASSLKTNRAEASVDNLSELNPNVNIKALKSELDLAIQNHDVIVLTESTGDIIERLNKQCRKLNKFFFAAGSIFGQGNMNGWIFADLLDHYSFLEEEITSSPEPTSSSSKKYVEKSLRYVPFQQMITHPFINFSNSRIKRIPTSILGLLYELKRQYKHKELPEENELSVDAAFNTTGISKEFDIKQTAQNWGNQLSPVATVVGGILGQDILNVISGKVRPVCNLLFFIGIDMLAPIYEFGYS